MAVKEAIAYLGGVTKVAELMGVSKSAVSQWILADQIPGKRMPEFKKLVGRKFKAADLNRYY